MTIKELSHFIRYSLREVYPENEIQSLVSIIFEKKVNLKKTDILLNRAEGVNQKTVDEIIKIVDQLKMAVPIQYILGETTFYDLSLEVNPSVLIPRQETEELVDWIIKDNPETGLKILDIGTGSGCIAITLAKNLKKPDIDAVDTNQNIIDLAKKNAQQNKVKINAFIGDILKDMPDTNNYDIIVSNPPYVLESEKRNMHDNVVLHEPESALYVPDSKALIYYQNIASYAFNNLKVSGKLYFEINEKKGKEIRTLLKDEGFSNVEIKKDINGKDRMIKAKKP